MSRVVNRKYEYENIVEIVVEKSWIIVDYRETVKEKYCKMQWIAAGER